MSKLSASFHPRKTCPAAPRRSRATFRPPCPARLSKFSTPTRKAASSLPTASTTRSNSAQRISSMPLHSPVPSSLRSPMSTSEFSAPIRPGPTNSSPAPKSSAKKCGSCLWTTSIANSSRAASLTFRTSAAAKEAAPSRALGSSANLPAIHHGFTWTLPARHGMTTPSPGWPKARRVWRFARWSIWSCRFRNAVKYDGWDRHFCLSSNMHSSLARGQARMPVLALHLLGCFDSHQRKCPHQLCFHQFRKTQQKCPLLLIRFRQDVVFVVEIIEFLRQLKHMLRYERGLLRGNRRVHRVIQ